MKEILLGEDKTFERLVYLKQKDNVSFNKKLIIIQDSSEPDTFTIYNHNNCKNTMLVYFRKNEGKVTDI